MTKVNGKCLIDGEKWENNYIGPQSAIMDTINFLVANTGLKNIEMSVGIRDDGVVGPEKLVLTAGHYEMTIDLTS